MVFKKFFNKIVEFFGKLQIQKQDFVTVFFFKFSKSSLVFEEVEKKNNKTRDLDD